ncbi:protein white [Centruroides vittatus]|uniref:protein white n=1 Tax=Centruroides vittatus TaxID=120091 RepID=UPI0035106C0C
MKKEKLPLLGNGTNNFKNYSSISKQKNTSLNVSILSCQDVILSWNNITAIVEAPKRKWFFSKSSKKHEHRYILRDVSGNIGPGQLLAIMGSSGAGKTTLMNVLTSRNLQNVSVYGKVSVNGYPMDNSIIGMSGYVQQDDLFIGTLTVREHLIFQALLRMDQNLSKKVRLQRVDDVIAYLGLSKCANTNIGIPGRIKGISGGEMKRLSFASEILTNPSLLFCDEPTSGLDTFMALSIISILREMAAAGCTIVCSIHQPSSEVYALFDQVLFLANGQVAFMGSASRALDFFSDLGLQCPTNFNPADFFISELSILPDQEEYSKKRIQQICESYANIRNRSLTNGEVIKESAERIKNVTKNCMYKASWWVQFYVIIWRSFLSIRRNPILTTMRFVQTIIVALILGFMYWKQTLDQDGIMNINGVLFLLLTNVTFQNMLAVINVFCADIPVFLREHWNGMYRVGIYVICKMLAELPTFIVLPALFTSIVYWMVGLRADVTSFFLCVGIVTLASNAACSFGYMISSCSTSISMAISIGPPMIIPLMLFGGFLLNIETIPIYFDWVKYLSWFYYGNEAMSIIQWSGVEHIACNNSTVCIKNGDIVLESLNFNKDHLTWDIMLLCVLIVGYRLLAYIGLYIKTIHRK